MHLALIHYLYPPTVGGVERVMAEHAALFARRGHRVTVLCGGGESDGPGVEVRVIPELAPGAVVRIEEIREILEEGLRGVEVVFVHNVMTMPFNPAATEALAEMASSGLGSVRFINWIHDLAAINPDYVLDARQRAFLGKAQPGFRHVAVSVLRQREFCELTGTLSSECLVVPNGCDPAKVLGLTPAVAELARRRGILGRDIVLLQPARILRRKNIELGLRVTAALRRGGHDTLYLVTGAPDPHHPVSASYGETLRAMSDGLDLGDSVVFAAEDSPVADSDLPGLYALADAVFLPSHHEGFGLPVLEAALLRLPVFCADREPMRSLLTGYPGLFQEGEVPEEIAAGIWEVLSGNPAYSVRKEALAKYRWEAIYDDYLEPLLRR